MRRNRRISRKDDMMQMDNDPMGDMDMTKPDDVTMDTEGDNEEPISLDAEGFLVQSEGLLEELCEIYDNLTASARAYEAGVQMFLESVQQQADQYQDNPQATEVIEKLKTRFSNDQSLIQPLLNQTGEIDIEEMLDDLLEAFGMSEEELEGLEGEFGEFEDEDDEECEDDMDDDYYMDDEEEGDDW